MMGIFRIALRNLKRNKRRNLATGTAMALGFAGFLIIGGFYERVAQLIGVYTVYPSMSGHLQIYKKEGLQLALITPATHALDHEDLDIIKAAVGHLDNAAFSGARIVGEGFASNGCASVPFWAMGVEPQVSRQVRSHPLVKRWIGAIISSSKGQNIDTYEQEIGPIAVTPGMARILGKTQVHDELSAAQQHASLSDCSSAATQKAFALDANVQLAAATWDGLFATRDAEIVTTISAVQADLKNTLISAPLGLLQSLYHTEGATLYTVWLKDAAQIDADFSRLQGLLDQSGRAYEVYRWDDARVNPYYVGAMKFMAVLFTFLSSVASLVIFFSIFNSATITVIERTAEVGMFRAIGYKRAHIERLFVVEFLLLCASALVAGALLGAAGASLINHLDIPYAPPSVAIPLTVVIVPSWGAALCGTISIASATLVVSFWVARRLSRRPIAHILTQAHR